MSTTERDHDAAASAETDRSASSGDPSPKQDSRSSGSSPADTGDDGKARPTAESMREGAMARVAPRRDLSARRAGAA
ncbi:MAG: hypothetical protein WBB15_01525, partial [Ornithinimicrobium sp.]